MRFTGKNKFHPITCHEGTDWGKRYRSTLSLTSALDWGGWSTIRTVCFTPGITRYPKNRWPCGLQGQSRWVRKIFLLTRIQSPDRKARLRYPGPFWELHGGDKHIVGAKCRVTGVAFSNHSAFKGHPPSWCYVIVLDSFRFLGLSRALTVLRKTFITAFPNTHIRTKATLSHLPHRRTSLISQTVYPSVSAITLRVDQTTEILYFLHSLFRASLQLFKK